MHGGDGVGGDMRVKGRGGERATGYRGRRGVQGPVQYPPRGRRACAAAQAYLNVGIKPGGRRMGE